MSEHVRRCRCRLSSETQPRCRWTIFIASMQTRLSRRIARQFRLDLARSSCSHRCRLSIARALSSIDVRQHEIEAAENREQVRDHAAAAQQRHHLHVRERRRADACRDRRSCCRRSSGSSRCSLWWPRCRRSASPGGITGPQLTLRKCVIRVSMSCIVRSLSGGVVSGWSDLYGPARHVFHALLDDAQALPHLLDAHDRAVVAVAVLSRSGCRTRTARSPSRAAVLRKSQSKPQARRTRARSRPTRSPRPACRRRSLRARLENAVLHHQRVVLAQARRAGTR